MKKKKKKLKQPIFFLQFVNNNSVYDVVSDFLGCDMCLRNKINSLVSKMKEPKVLEPCTFQWNKKC